MNTLSRVAVLACLGMLIGCADDSGPAADGNPFLVALNEPVAYGVVSAEDVTEYAQIILDRTSERAAHIGAVANPEFESVIRPLDALVSELQKASSNAWMLYWVSPDSATRRAGFEGFQRLDSASTAISSDRAIFERVAEVQTSSSIDGTKSKLVEDLLAGMRQSGVALEPADLEAFKALRAEINDLTMQFSTNMNTDIPTLVLDEESARGLPASFTSSYETGEGSYAVPVMPATGPVVMGNAESEGTRRRYFIANATRAAEENLPVLDELIRKRHELGRMMGARSYAEYGLKLNMARDPGRVWAFLDDLITRTTDKARSDLQQMQALQKELWGTPPGAPVAPWNSTYLRNTILKGDFDVDNELIREYLPMQDALVGMMALYQELLGLEFRQVANPSVWHEEVEAYEVFEGGELVGRFYLDLFPRPNKEGWFYGVPLTPGRQRAEGYEIPVAMLLGNFTRPTDEIPSLVAHSELRTLFHEFGHIMNAMSYRGEFAAQSGSKADFGEAMSQIFENWIWDYDVVKTFARHYETGEVLPEDMFDNMLAARNVSSGLNAQAQVDRAVYDMMLYDRYDPAAPIDTDALWGEIADRFVYAPHVDGTHLQASWIHINTHPVYYYGYLWSAVYAADMFTEFEANGLWDQETGVRYRELILANGTQRPIDAVVEEFLGRPMSNEAYVRGLGLEPEGRE